MRLTRLLLVPDTHAPFHDRKAWALMIKAARKYQPDVIVHLGDLVDCYSVSAHDRDPRRVHQLSAELRAANSLLDDLDSLGAARKVFCEGNHEYRLERYLLQHAPALLDSIDMGKLLHLKRRGWDEIPYHEFGKVGKLYVTHEAGFCGANAIKQTGDAFRHNVAFGHSHRLGVSYFGTVTGERYVSANLGWLGDTHEAKYAHNATKAQWALGFGVGRIEKSGIVHLRPVPIVGYTCVLDGGVIRI